MNRGLEPIDQPSRRVFELESVTDSSNRPLIRVSNPRIHRLSRRCAHPKQRISSDPISATMVFAFE